ncbi:MAG: hypothetical protein HKO02_04550 [Hyphomonadaceae bacterium]|nr:hypothetical protein [Hyphomonadaceae bacterium]
MRAIIGTLLALLGTLGTLIGVYMMYTKVTDLMESEDALASGMASIGSASGLTLTLVGLIAMYVSLEPKQAGAKKEKKKRVDTH